jgi:hypothetical protein
MARKKRASGFHITISSPFHGTAERVLVECWPKPCFQNELCSILENATVFAALFSCSADDEPVGSTFQFFGYAERFFLVRAEAESVHAWT